MNAKDQNGKKRNKKNDGEKAHSPSPKNIDFFSDAPEGVRFVEGGLSAVEGVRASGVHAGFRKNASKPDLALVSVPSGSSCAGVFTQSKFCAAPVQLSREVARGGRAQALILNSGNANAATGARGLEIAHRTAALVASALAVPEEEVFVASTGVIGVQIDFNVFETGLPLAIQALGSSPQCAEAAARAIMTTDTEPKQAAVEFRGTQSDGTEVSYRIGGMAKGSGMIEPNLATMLAVIATDASVEPSALNSALREAAAVSFNRVTIDGDTSTNDSVFLVATGAAPGKTIVTDCPLYPQLVAALKALCVSLARQMAADGEGATKLVTVKVVGAANDEDAVLAAKAMANSPLVKTAIAGRDANWGRLAAALGKSDARFRQEDVSLWLMGIEVCRDGLAVDFDEEEAARRFEEDEIEIVADLGCAQDGGESGGDGFGAGTGAGAATVWTCDLTHDYIAINADYRT